MVMASRCVSAIDEINSIALEIERKNRKNNCCYVAKETLARIKRERKLFEASRNKSSRPASLPGDFHKERGKEDRHHRKRLSSDEKHARKDSWSRPSSRVSQNGHRSPSPRTASTSPHERPMTVPGHGKSYTNRCVKEILNKLEQGAYASEWYSFTRPDVPSPKWINFNSGENGGVLDAFICSKNDKEAQTCYMMDVRIGEKVGRLLKYPGTVRVGQNGCETGRKNEKESTEYGMEDAYEYSEVKPKTRPFPLSWDEQIKWEDAKIVTVPELDKNQDKVDEYGKGNRLPRTIGIERKKESRNFTADSKVTHKYVIEPVNLRVVQNFPCMKARQKYVRGFQIANRSAAEARRDSVKMQNDRRNRMAQMSRKTGWESPNSNKKSEKELVARHDFISVNRSPLGNSVGRQDGQLDTTYDDGNRNISRLKDKNHSDVVDDACVAKGNLTEGGDENEEDNVTDSIKDSLRVYGRDSSVDATTVTAKHYLVDDVISSTESEDVKGSCDASHSGNFIEETSQGGHKHLNFAIQTDGNSLRLNARGENAAKVQETVVSNEIGDKATITSNENGAEASNDYEASGKRHNTTKTRDSGLHNDQGMRTTDAQEQNRSSPVHQVSGEIRESMETIETLQLNKDLSAIHLEHSQ